MRGRCHGQRVGEPGQREEGPGDGTRKAGEHRQRQRYGNPPAYQHEQREQTDGDPETVGNTAGEQPHAHAQRERGASDAGARPLKRPLHEQAEQASRGDRAQREQQPLPHQRPKAGASTE